MKKLDSLTARPRADLPRSFCRAALLLLVFLCAFIPLRNALELGLGTWVKLLPDLLIAALFVWYAVLTRLRLRVCLQDGLLLFFFLVSAVVSFACYGVSPVAFVFQVRSMAIYYLLYFVLRNVTFSARGLALVLRTLQGVSLLLFVYALVEKIFSKTVLFPTEWAEGILYASNYTRVYNLFNNPNTYGLFLVFVFFFSLFFRLRYGIKTHALLYASLFGALLLTMSRSSLIALIIGGFLLLCCLLIKQRARLDYKRLACYALVILTLGTGVYFGARTGSDAYLRSLLATHPEMEDSILSDSVAIGGSDRWEDTLTEQELEESGVDGRMYSLRKGFELFGHYPAFGTGLTTFGSSGCMSYGTWLTEAHGVRDGFYSDNEYITLLVETGLVGMVLFAAFIFCVVWPHRRDYTVLILSVLFAWLGLFYNVFEVQIGAMLFWLLLALPDSDETRFAAGLRQTQTGDAPTQTLEEARK